MGANAITPPGKDSTVGTLPGVRQGRHPSPTDERLRHTIAERMRMSPIDQPLMLMEPALGEQPPGASKIQAADQLLD